MPPPRAPGAPPVGIVQPSAAAIAGGLSFALAFQNGPEGPFLARGSIAAPAFNGGSPGMLRGGQGMAGPTSGWGSFSSGNQFPLSITAGTVLLHVVADHAANDGAFHNLFQIGDNVGYPGPPLFAMLNAGGTWVCGWIGGGDWRVGVSASGTYAVGDAFTVALAWDGAGQRLYVKGALVGSNTTAIYGDTSGSCFEIGMAPPADWYWATTSGGGVISCVIIDRALSADELAAAEADPWWWIEEPARTPRRVGALLRRLRAFLFRH